MHGRGWTSWWKSPQTCSDQLPGSHLLCRYRFNSSTSGVLIGSEEGRSKTVPSGVFTKPFQQLLDSGCVPHHWKESTIIPIPKKSYAKDLNDFRPVALTSVLCKCMGRVVCAHLSNMVAERVDPLQFAYKAKCGVEDACLTLLDMVGNQLDSIHPHNKI